MASRAGRVEANAGVLAVSMSAVAEPSLDLSCGPGRSWFRGVNPGWC